MSANSVFRFINNQKFLFGLVVLFFVPFILFSFWSVPAADDYMILYRKQQYSFWGLQNWIYQTWSGRYLSTFISTVFSYTGLLYSHYYLHPVLLLLFTVLAWIYLLKHLNKYLLRNVVSQRSVILVSLLLLIFEINIIPEPVTAFYWFSSAITYQVPLILMPVLVAVIIQLVGSTAYRIPKFIAAVLLIVLVNGCNESITLFLLAASTCLIIFCAKVYKKIPVALLGLYCINIISSGFLLFAPGILHRSALHESSPLALIFSIAMIKFIVLHWFFLKEPVWWFFVMFATSFLSNFQPGISLVLNITRHQFVAALLMYFATALFIYIPILYVANGSIPLRTENIICFLYSLISLVIISIFLSHRRITPSRFTTIAQYKYILLSILIFSSPNMKKVMDSLLSGFFYSQVMLQRRDVLEEAKLHQRSEVSFDNYETAVSKQLVHYPLLNRRLLKDIILKPPPIICFQTDFYDLPYVRDLYGIKKIGIDKR